MIMELHYRRAIEIPLSNSTLLKLCLCLRLCSSDRRGISLSTTSTIVLVREIDEAGRERGEEPNDDGISKEGDGIVSLETEGPFSFDRRSKILTVSPNCSRTIKEDWSGWRQ